MINQAIIVKDNFVVCQDTEQIYEGDFDVKCNAIMKVFMASRPDEIKEGILFASGCAGLTEASLIISANLSKAVFSREPLDSDELCAIELLKERNISVVFNPNMIIR